MPQFIQIVTKLTKLRVPKLLQSQKNSSSWTSKRVCHLGRRWKVQAKLRASQGIKRPIFRSTHNRIPRFKPCTNLKFCSFSRQKKGNTWTINPYRISRFKTLFSRITRNSFKRLLNATKNGSKGQGRPWKEPAKNCYKWINQIRSRVIGREKIISN